MNTHALCLIALSFLSSLAAAPVFAQQQQQQIQQQQCQTHQQQQVRYCAHGDVDAVRDRRCDVITMKVDAKASSVLYTALTPKDEGRLTPNRCNPWPCHAVTGTAPIEACYHAADYDGTDLICYRAVVRVNADETENKYACELRRSVR